MSFIDSLRTSWRELSNRNAVDDDLEREMRFHLEMESAANRAKGLDAGAARRKALIDFGGVQRHKEEVRDGRALRWFEDLLVDLRYAMRRLAHAPAFALSAVVILSLGIGSASAVAAIVDQLLRRSMPYPEADRIIFATEATDKGEAMLTSWPNFVDWRQRSQSLTQLSAFTTQANEAMVVAGEAIRGTTQQVSADFFSVFGVVPIAGRLILADENRRGGAPVALVSERLWRSQMSAAPLTPQSSVLRQGRRYQIVGVLPGSFSVITHADLWIPARQTPVEVRGAGNYSVVGRLHDNVVIDAGRAELNTIARALKSEYGDASVSKAVVLTSLQDQVVSSARRPLEILLGASRFLLIVAAASIAMLQLARGHSRDRELGVRVSLGAGRVRILRQLLTEQLVLALSGAAGGIAVAAAAILAVRRFGAGLLPRIDELHFDQRVIVGAVVAAIGSVVLFGILPTLRLARTPGKLTAATVRGDNSARSFSLFVGLQSGVAVLLLCGAALLVSSLYRVLTTDLGYNRAGVVAVTVPLTGERYNDMARRISTAEEIRSSLAQLPGAGDVALTSQVPQQRGGNRGPILIAPFGNPDVQSSWASIASIRVVSEKYFDLMGIQRLQGELLRDADGPESRKVVINRALAKKLWPNADPIGRQLRALADPKADTLTVVGVVADAHDWRSAEGAQQEMYLLVQQRPQMAWQMNAVFRPTANVDATMSEARRRIRQIDAEMSPIIRTLDQAMDETIADRQFIGGIVVIFAAVVLLLTIAGVFGMVAYVVQRRTREIAIRIAIGASRREVWFMVQRGVIAAALVGCVAGVIGSLQFSKLLAALLYDVSPNSPAVLGAATVGVMAVIGIAASVPALRAVRIPPLLAMRGE